MVDSATQGSWDFAFILYTGINWLGYTEAEVWQLTPLKWDCLVRTYLDILERRYGVHGKTGNTDNTPTAYIDQIGW